MWDTLVQFICEMAEPELRCFQITKIYSTRQECIQQVKKIIQQDKNCEFNKNIYCQTLATNN